MLTVTFLPDQQAVEVGAGETLLDASLRSGMPTVCACEGMACCTTCRAWVLEGEENCEPRNSHEQQWAESLQFDSRIQLACQTTITGDVTLRRPVLNEIDLELVNRLNREDSTLEGRERDVADIAEAELEAKPLQHRQEDDVGRVSQIVEATTARPAFERTVAERGRVFALRRRRRSAVQYGQCTNF